MKSSERYKTKLLNNWSVRTLRILYRYKINVYLPRVTRTPRNEHDIEHGNTGKTSYKKMVFYHEKG